MYVSCKVYGPYLRSDGRQHVVIKDNNGDIRTVSYPKYLVEILLNKKLKANETVHHVDGDFNNNDISNLEVVDRVVHAKSHAKPKWLSLSQEYKCKECGKVIILKNQKLRALVCNLKRGKVGPFCCQECSGRYGKRVQMRS